VRSILLPLILNFGARITDFIERETHLVLFSSRAFDRMIQTEVTLSASAPCAHRADEGTFPCRMRQWDLVELAAEGNLTRVYRAKPSDAPSHGSPRYAIKMLRPEWEDDPRAMGLLEREALVGRSVSHPHLIPILESHLGSPPRLLVMPWLEGATLEAQLGRVRWVDRVGWVDRSAPHPDAAEDCAAGLTALDLPEVLWFARQVAEGLAALDRAGWMHGDVKPSNIFVSPEGHVTLLDLGFARRTDETGSAQQRCVTGTCNYLAPEWITSALRADIRSDIYSLGVVLFQLLCGRLPFDGHSLAELATQHLQSAPPNLVRLAPHLPRELIELVRRMLAKDPLRRPQTLCDVVDELAALEIATFAERA
jgi:eukaryotic-like serine/threonine-protein kinase